MTVASKRKYTADSRPAPVNPPNYSLPQFVTALRWRQNPQALIRHHRENAPERFLEGNNHTGLLLRWKSELKKNGELREKYEKQPVNPHTGGWGSSTDPTTWGTFDEAAQCYLADTRKNNIYRARVHGLGVVLTIESRVVVFDIDKCIDPVTGEFTEPWVRDLIYGPLNNSYRELSLSGTGIHIFCETDLILDEGIHNVALPYEVYPTERFVATTANRPADSPREIRRVDDVWLEDTYKKYKRPASKSSKAIYTAVLDSIKNATVEDILEDQRAINRMLTNPRRGALARRLFTDGDTTAWGDGKSDDNSSADFALLNHILSASVSDWNRYREVLLMSDDDPYRASYLTRLSARMDRIFRQSKLIRNKWDERRGDLNYGQYSIANLFKNEAKDAQERAEALNSGEIF